MAFTRRIRADAYFAQCNSVLSNISKTAPVYRTYPLLGL